MKEISGFTVILFFAISFLAGLIRLGKKKI